MSSRLARFTAQRQVGGVETLSWQNLIANINDFFAANNITFIDLHIEQRTSTRRGLDKLFAYVLYRERAAGAVGPTYIAEGNTTNDASPTWFDAVTDAEADTFRTVALVPAPTVPGSDAENGKQYLRIKFATPAPSFGMPTAGTAYIGQASGAIAPAASGSAVLFTSDLAASLGLFTVYNLSPTDPIQDNERTLVTVDPETGRLVALPFCC